MVGLTTTVTVLSLVLTYCLSWFQAPQPAVHVQGQEPLTASMLAAAPPQEQKQMLGECLQKKGPEPVTDLNNSIQALLGF